MSDALAGKIAMVTGASRGIGRAIAHKLAAAGCDVAVNYYNSHDEAAAVCAAIRAVGRHACAIQGNVGHPESVEELFAEFRQHFDRLDILVSNAATGVLKPVLEMSLKHWRWCLETNALALALLAQRAVPLMPAGGRIVATSSLGANRAIPGYGFIGSSKAALESLVRHMAVELGPQGINVNTISAGAVDTEALKKFPNRQIILDTALARTPLGRLTLPEDVADVSLFLCSDLAKMISGQTLVVDGGYSIRA